jgi:hypothetical protein
MRSTYQYPSLAILYEPSHPPAVVVAVDDDVHRMGILVGRSSQIEPRPMGGRGVAERYLGVS